MTSQNLKRNYYHKKIQEELQEENITISMKEYRELYQVKEQLQKLKSEMLEHCDTLGGVFIKLITDNYHTKHHIRNDDFDY